MARPSVRIVFEILAGFIAGLLILTGIGIWRLSSGPVSLSFLTPSIQEALHRPDSPFSIEIEDTILTWGGWDRAVDIALTDVTLRRADGEPLAALPQISVGLSIEALVRGELAPTELQLKTPEVLIQRSADGSFAMGMMGAGEVRPSPDADSSDEMTGSPTMMALPALQSLMRPPKPGTRLAYLTKISILDARVIMVDEVADLTWELPDANIILVRQGSELRGNVSATLTAEDTETRISAVLLHALEDTALNFNLSFDRFNPALIARALPEAAFLRDVKAELSGSVGLRIAMDGSPVDADLTMTGDFGRVTVDLGFAEDGSALVADMELIDVQTREIAALDPRLGPLSRLDTLLNGPVTLGASPDGEIQALQFDVRAGAGTIDLSEIGIRGSEFREGTLRGAINADLGSIQVDALTLGLLDATELSATATVTPVEGIYQIVVDGELRDMPFSQLADYWPERVGIDARKWVTGNILSGSSPLATLSAEFAVPVDQTDAVEVIRLGGEIGLVDGEVHFFRPMPPALGVVAKAGYTATGFDIVAEKGLVEGDIRLSNGRVLITGIGADEAIDITVDAQSDLTKALQLLESEPLRLVSVLGLNPAAVTGQGGVAVRLTFPLTRDLKLSDVDYAANANLSNVAVAETPLDIPLLQGEMGLKLDRSGLEVSGNAFFEETPVALSWRENFPEDANYKTAYTARGRLTDNQLARFGLDIAGRAVGSIDTNVTYVLGFDGTRLIDLNGEITDLSLTIPELAWEKPTGQPGSIQSRIRLTDNAPSLIETVNLQTEGLVASGSARFDATFDRFLDGQLDRLEMPGNSFSATVLNGEDNRLTIDIVGEELTIGHLLEDFQSSDQEEETNPELGTPYDLSASIVLVHAGQDRLLDDVTAVLSNDGERFRQIMLDAQINDSALSFAMVPNGAGEKLTINAEDGGATFTALDWTDRVEGGVFVLDAERVSKDQPFVGDITLSDFRVTNAPGLAKVLEFMSLTGVLSSLGSDGLDFIELESEISLKDGVLTASSGRAYGASIGITGDGTIDVENEMIDIGGTIVPAYTVNRIIGAIPLLGPLVTGGEGQGIFAANYKIDGPLEDPVAAVNPLSALAPSFLRRLFKADTSPELNQTNPEPGQNRN